jgi:peroxiredoxin
MKAYKPFSRFRCVLRGLAVWIAVVAALEIMPGAARRGWGQLAPDQAAPAFALQDSQGRRHNLSDARGSDLVILFFVDLESSSNRKGLSRVSALLESRREPHVRAFAVTPSPEERAKAFTQENPISFPLLIDNAGVIDLYHSHLILPTVYILDRDLMVRKVVLGGGRSMEIQLERAMEEAVATAGARARASDSRELPDRGAARETEARQRPSIPPPPIRKTVESPQDKARKLFQLAREENLKLTWDECLASKALERARTLYEKGSLDHRDAGSGKNPAFEMVKSCAGNAATAGENLSRGMGMTSRSIHQEFMASSTHRQNIQNRRFSKMGVGCHETICVELFVGF